MGVSGLGHLSAWWCSQYGMEYFHRNSGSRDIAAVVFGADKITLGCHYGIGVALRQPEPHNPFGLRFDSLEAHERCQNKK